MLIMTTEYLYDKEIGHILALLTPPNRLVMRLMLHTGMRVSDAVSLRRICGRLGGIPRPRLASGVASVYLRTCWRH